MRKAYAAIGSPTSVLPLGRTGASSSPKPSRPALSRSAASIALERPVPWSSGTIAISTAVKAFGVSPQIRVSRALRIAKSQPASGRSPSGRTKGTEWALATIRPDASRQTRTKSANSSSEA